MPTTTIITTTQTEASWSRTGPGQYHLSVNIMPTPIKSVNMQGYSLAELHEEKKRLN